MQSSLDGCAEDSYFSANFPACHSYVDCVAQPVEHPTFNQVVVGSSPTAVTILPKLMESKKPKHLCSGLMSLHDFSGMAVGGCQKARSLSNYLIVLPLSFNFRADVREEPCRVLPLIITEQKIVTTDTDSFDATIFYSFLPRENMSTDIDIS